MRLYGLLAPAAAAATAVFLSCGGEAPLAGGTGSGNPGNAVASVKVIADTAGTSSPAKRLAGGPNAPFLDLPQQDTGDLPMKVESVTITVRRVHFLLDETENPAELLGDFEGKVAADSESIFLEGPVTFDVLTGGTVPSLDSVKLPPARYTGLKLEAAAPGGGPQTGSPDRCASRIVGSYEWSDTSGAFTFCLSPRIFISKRAGGPYRIGKADTVDFVLRLDWERWLEGTDLKSCIDEGSLPLDPGDELLIDAQSGIGSCELVEETIGENFAGSGRLDVGRRGPPSTAGP